MIDETSAFLTWALGSGVELPKVPRRRVDSGGFSQFLRAPGAKAAVERWWSTALAVFEQVR